MLIPQADCTGVCSVNANGCFTDEDVNATWSGAVDQATNCLGPSGGRKLFLFRSFGAGGSERSTHLPELGGAFVGQEGGVQADTSALLPLTGSSVEVTSSVSVSPSVKWEEARE